MVHRPAMFLAHGLCVPDFGSSSNSLGTALGTGRPFVHMDTRTLQSLSGIGPAMLQDFDQLGIQSVKQLASADPDELYERLCTITKTRQDPCVLDTFRCAVAQARDPQLPAEQRNWWYWSRQRKGSSK